MEALVAAVMAMAMVVVVPSFASSCLFFVGTLVGVSEVMFVSAFTSSCSPQKESRGHNRILLLTILIRTRAGSKKPVDKRG